jgi:uncharacterized integral membrane protein
MRCILDAMKLSWGRIIVGTLLAEAVLFLTFFVLVAIFGPTDPEAAREFSMLAGRWHGPIVGALVSFLGGWWVARPLAERRPLHGLLVGLFLAILDFAFLAVSAVDFEWLFGVSNLGKLVAGYLGGRLAAQG